jgi:hypothetical protein
MSLTYVSAELRRVVRERARDCCEYCLIPEAFGLLRHEVDHISAEKHGGETVDANLALSCAICNQHKGTDLTSIDPTTGAIEPLFHPRKNRWSEHFQLIDGRIEPLTPIGRVTARLLQFSRPERIAERLVLARSGNLSAPE